MFRRYIDDNNKKIRRIKAYMIAGYTLIIILAIVFISTLTLSKTDEILKTKVSTITSVLNNQMKLNTNSFLSRIETTSALIFASDEVYEYDATDSSIDQYTALNTEKTISDKLYDLCIMENYVDFAIVYANNHTTGKMSNGTLYLFGENLYDDLSAVISRQHTNDGWSVGFDGDFKRIYYVKRVNENAVLVTSIYSSELENVLERSEELQDMTIRLITNDNSIIYSTKSDEKSGSGLPEDIKSRISENNSATIIDNEYLITITSCADNWYVLCSIPTSLILSERKEIKIYVTLTAVFAAILAIFVSTLLSIKTTKPVSNIVSSLDNEAHTDRLTGIYNKHYFEKSTSDMIQSSSLTEHHALILLDVDNFKGVNDTLGHAYGDKVLSNVGIILKRIFSMENDCIGRIGGDEFCVFLNIPSDRQNDSISFITEKCKCLCDEFHNNYTGDDGKYKISASIGVALFPDNGQSFSELYKTADKALYSSKHKGKDTYTIYSAETDGDL